jgi:diaminopimelate decarboxylase
MRVNMQHFHYKNNQLYAESLCVAEIANQFGTPCYVYSEAALEDNWQAFEHAFKGFNHRICYAVKANSNIAILNFFAKKDAGFDIVSQGELERVLVAQGDPKKIVFSGVGKQTAEIIRALEVGIGCFNVESLPELERIHAIAEEQKTIATVALRVNPDIDARTHPHISTGLSTNKFGIEYNDVIPLCLKIQKMPNIRLIGIACHIGSQLTELSPFLEASDRMLHLLEHLKQVGIELDQINMGGGLGIQYHDEKPPTLNEYATAIRKKFENLAIELIIEYIKTTSHKNFAIIDAGMNDLIRPALYDAWHDILPVSLRYGDTYFYDIVGPVCESADVLGRSRQIALEPGDILAIKTAGAYGFSMSSNYNSRPRPAEVMIRANNAHLIRKRESLEELFAKELIF